MKKLTQRERVKRHLIEHGSITNVEAFQMQILRLSERIRELEADGFRIDGDWVREGGKKSGTYRYVLVGAPEQPKRKIGRVIIGEDGKPRAVIAYV